MEKIQEFTKGSVFDFSYELEQVLKSFGEAYGVTIKTNGGTFDQRHLKLRLSCTVDDPVGGVPDQYEATFSKLAPRYGFYWMERGRQFKRGKDVFELYGFEPKARRYPVVCKRVSDGKLCRLTPRYVRACLREQKLQDRILEEC